jgi:hypothetical protein
MAEFHPGATIARMAKLNPEEPEVLEVIHDSRTTTARNPEHEELLDDLEYESLLRHANVPEEWLAAQDRVSINYRRF